MSVERFCGYFLCVIRFVQFRRRERILRMLFVVVSYLLELCRIRRKDVRLCLAEMLEMIVRRFLVIGISSNRILHDVEISSFFGRVQGDSKGEAYTTICLRASRGLRMNLRVRRVTGVSAILVVSW